MTPDSLSFDYGNLTTVLGMVGLLSTALIVFTAFRKHYRSPYNK